LPETELKFWDERLSSVAAEKSLISFDVSRKKRRKVIDKMAASFILQGYLDSLKEVDRTTFPL
jgi:putative Holliday junction resolvase